MKECRRCGERKDASKFSIDRASKDGLRSACKACDAAARRKRYRADPERYKASVRRWQRKNAERHDDYQRRYKAEVQNRERERDAHLRRSLGIGLETYTKLRDSQGNRCAICLHEPEDGQRLHVDHDHTSGRVRGLLCVRCNNAIGLLGEDLDAMEEAVFYSSMNDRIAALLAMRSV